MRYQGLKYLAVLALLGAGMIALAANAAWAFETYDEIGFVVTALPMGFIAFAGLWVARRAPQTVALLVIFGVGIILRIIAFHDDPLLSTDIFRYVWDGRVAHAGINPYRYIPADPALAFLRDADVYPQINRADYAHTAYPPIAQMFFYLATTFASTLNAMRLAFLGVEVLAIAGMLWMLSRLKKPLVLIIGYVWHPLAIWEVANTGHVDTLLMLFVVLAMMAIVAHRQVFGALVISAGVLVKPYAIAMLPAFWRPWGIVAPIASVALVVICYLPYLGVGEGVLGFIPTYLNEEGFVAGGGYWLVTVVRHLVGTLPHDVEIYLALGALVLAGYVLRILSKPKFYDPQDQIRDLGILFFIGLFVLSPNYPWYYLPLVPFVVVEGSLTMWAATALVVGMHSWWPTPEDQPTRFLFWKTILNIGWMLALAVDLWRGRKLRQSALPQSEQSLLTPLEPGATR